MKPMPLAYLAVVGCLLLVAQPVRAQGADEQIKKVFADWEKRRAAIPRIRYTVVGQSIIPKGSLTDDLGHPFSPPVPPQDIPQRQDSTFLLDLPKNRFRLELVGQAYYMDKKELAPRAFTTVFDSQTYATEIPREANTSTVAPRQPSEPDVVINRDYARYQPLMTVNSYWLAPLLLAHGLLPRYLDPADFRTLHDSDDFTVQGQHLYGGRQCLVLRNFPEHTGGTQTSFDEYWIDTGRDSAIVRQLAYVNDKLRLDCEITYQQTPQGWLPLRWTGTTVRNGDQVINVTRLRVQEFSIDPPVEDAAFRPEIKPGMNILETTFEDPEKIQSHPPGYRLPTKFYHVGADGSWNEVVNGVEYKSHRWLWYGLGGFVAIAVVAALGFWYWRRRQRIRGSTSPAL